MPTMRQSLLKTKDSLIFQRKIQKNSSDTSLKSISQQLPKLTELPSKNSIPSLVSTSSYFIGSNTRGQSKDDYEPTPSSKFLQNATYSELLLEAMDHQKNISIDSSQSTELKSSMRLLYAPKKPGDHCGGFESDSLNTISIQNLEYPYNIENKPIEHISRTTLTVMPDKDSSEGYYHTKASSKKYESSMSYGDGWIIPISQKFEDRKCPEKSKKIEKYQIPKKREINEFKIGKKFNNTSEEITDSAHTQTSKPKSFHGRQWMKPCKHSFVAGAVRPYIGNCPRNFEELSKFSKIHQKFYVTQDPQKSYCLRNPEFKNKKNYADKVENQIFTNLVTNAENICDEALSQKSDSEICEVIDLENPLNLDFQGMDYWNTYQNDEQDFQNQCIYRRVGRYMERRKMKEEIAKATIHNLNAVNNAVPEYFQVEDRNEHIKQPPKYSWAHRFGQLYRSADKPQNMQRVENVLKAREQRYQQAFKLTAEKKIMALKVQEVAAEEIKKNLMVTLADEQFENVKKVIEEKVDPPEADPNRKLKRIVKVYRTFPHTIRETRQLKKELKKKNRIDKDAAIIKRDFYKERFNKDKIYPQADLEFSDNGTESNGNETPLSEQSTDYEDDMQVGKEHDRIKLRGFHYKMSTNIRGKMHSYETKKKGCITREEWLHELFPPKKIFKTDVERGFQRITDPDHPDLELFLSNFNYKMKKAKSSSIKDYIQRHLGRQYKHIFRKNVRIVRPRLKYTVKKFNLIRFLHGHKVQRFKLEGYENLFDKNVKIKTTLECIRENEQKDKELRESKNRERMMLLGIPCKNTNETKAAHDVCERESGGDDNDNDEDNGRNLDWVPTLEQLDELEQAPEMHGSFQSGSAFDISKRCNMPAPNCRESTLRCNPHKPRNYKLERVPTALFDETVKISDKPHLSKLPPDEKLYENVRCINRPYHELFETRRHHDHWNPTQQKLVDVHYQQRLPKLKVNKNIKRNIEKQNVNNTQENVITNVRPPCAAYVHKDLTLPDIDVDAMLAEYFKKYKKQRINRERPIVDECVKYDLNFHSRNTRNWDNVTFPGRQKYLNFLAEIHETLEEEKKIYNDEIDEIKLLVNKDEMIKELEEDLKSIESNLISVSSSECTNYSNDSGSILLLDGKFKLPLDYIRKSMIPFDELQRSRFNAVPIDIEKELANPYTTFPFSGQKKAQIELQHPTDAFNTYKTRFNKNLRLRLEVPVDDVNEKLLLNLDCRAKNKNKNKTTTNKNKNENDIFKRNFITEKTRKPPVKMVGFKSGLTYIKDALRLKFESMVIHNQLVRTKIYDRLNDKHFQQMDKMSVMYERLFIKWEKTEYNHAMSVVYQVKSYYETTDILRKEFRALKRELVLLNMDIVFIEGSWIRGIMLQNFHYLLADQYWRAKHDWIHRLSPVGRRRQKKKSSVAVFHEGIEDNDYDDNLDDTDDSEDYDSIDDDEIQDVILETYDVSIANRTTQNIRVREKDDAFAIKKYYEEVYENNIHPVLIVFPDADSFLKGVEHLKNKTFVLLLEMHYTLTIQTELQGHLEGFEESCKNELQEKKAFVERTCAKKYFMEDRAKDLKLRVIEFLNKPLEESFAEPKFTADCGIIKEAWHAILPEHVRSVTEHQEPLNMARMINEHILDTLLRYESLPEAEMREIEVEIRFQHERAVARSKEAYTISKRIEKSMKRMHRNLEPPFVKPKRVGKLHRQHLHLRTKVVEEPPMQLTEHTKNFCRAFKELNAEITEEDIEESLKVADQTFATDDSVPFYFDHFLRMNGYKPNYNFITETELRDGAETNFMHCKKLIPEVFGKLKKWEKERWRKMVDDINKTPKLYLL